MTTLSQDERDYLTSLLAEQPKARKQARGCVGAVLNITAWTLCLLVPIALLLRFVPELAVGYGLVTEQSMCRVIAVYCEATTTTTTPAQPPAAQPPFVPPSGGGQPPAPQPVMVGAPLPDCATVMDTTTACQQQQPQPTEPPAPTPEPAYVTSTCSTPPGERPCWLPADQPWSPPADVPATPIVLLPEPTSVPLIFSDSACAAWHPPLPYPEECE